ncbi:MAG: DUF1688 family protein, partial [Alphaproteobacteria bacterium]
DLAIPFHSRWRHFSAGGRARWAELAAILGERLPEERARIRFDLAVVSVLLDAGAGERWSYCESDGAAFGHSEGLAVASCHMFRRGIFSADPQTPCRADATALAAITSEGLAAELQVSEQNPMIGLAGRAALLRRLGAALAADRELFGEPPRIGHLFDYLSLSAAGGTLPARNILAALMRGLGAIWPGRECLAGVNLGDVWRHSALRTDDETDGLVPFHKLSQWLAYSLIEPLEEAGVAVTGIEELTGLAEYRNGGLLIDAGLIVPRDPTLLARRHFPGDEVVVEWRALTVALLDRIAASMRARLGLDAAGLPLARVLEGGTWAAGRRIARERRPGGGPPLTVESDGTVF